MFVGHSLLVCVTAHEMCDLGWVHSQLLSGLLLSSALCSRSLACSHILHGSLFPKGEVLASQPGIRGPVRLRSSDTDLLIVNPSGFPNPRLFVSALQTFAQSASSD